MYVIDLIPELYRFGHYMSPEDAPVSGVCMPGKFTKFGWKEKSIELHVMTMFLVLDWTTSPDAFCSPQILTPLLILVHVKVGRH